MQTVTAGPDQYPSFVAQNHLAKPIIAKFCLSLKLINKGNPKITQSGMFPADNLLYYLNGFNILILYSY
jgi:hypothetical protein